MTNTIRTRRARLGSAAAALLAVGALGLSACSTSEGSPDAGGASAGAPSSGSSTGTGQDVSVTTNVADGARDVPVDTVATVTAKGGTVQEVALTAAGGARVPGRLSADRTSWTADGRGLEPGVAYTLKVSAADANGEATTSTQRFTTQALRLDQQTYASIAPLDGETVGVGMPVVVSFDVAVTDKKTFEKHMHVTSEPAQKGSWRWVSDTEAHWRPQQYWQAGTSVSVDVDINSLPAGNGIYGQDSRTVAFEVGDANIYRIDARSHQMKVLSNGKLLRTIPVTVGKSPDFTTRSGVKVIMEKFDRRRMNSETVGIGRDNPEYYDIDDVQWAMRLTNSGEFIHAAPWSVGSQGRANVSHGCTGLSTADAHWLYQMTRRGDVVETVGTGRPMELDNGYGDWNASYAEYRKGSALA